MDGASAAKRRALDPDAAPALAPDDVEMALVGLLDARQRLLAGHALDFVELAGRAVTRERRAEFVAALDGADGAAQQAFVDGGGLVLLVGWLQAVIEQGAAAVTAPTGQQLLRVLERLPVTKAILKSSGAQPILAALEAVDASAQMRLLQAWTATSKAAAEGGGGGGSGGGGASESNKKRKKEKKKDKEKKEKKRRKVAAADAAGDSLGSVMARSSASLQRQQQRSKPVELPALLAAPAPLMAFDMMDDLADGAADPLDDVEVVRQASHGRHVRWAEKLEDYRFIETRAMAAGEAANAFRDARQREMELERQANRQAAHEAQAAAQAALRERLGRMQAQAPFAKPRAWRLPDECERPVAATPGAALQAARLTTTAAVDYPRYENIPPNPAPAPALPANPAHRVRTIALREVTETSTEAAASAPIVSQEALAALAAFGGGLAAPVAAPAPAPGWGGYHAPPPPPAAYGGYYAPPPPPPPPVVGRKRCHFFNSPQGCRNGDRCGFIHER